MNLKELINLFDLGFLYKSPSLRPFSVLEVNSSLSTRGIQGLRNVGTNFKVVFVLLTSVLHFSSSYIPFWLLHSPLKLSGCSWSSF